MKNVIPLSPVIREHLFPTVENVALIKKYRMKMVFHVRDLQHRVVSIAYYDLDYIKRGVKSKIVAYEKRGYDPTSLTLDDLIEIHISGLGGICKRIKGWLDIYKSRTIPMLITTYEEFCDNETLFFEKILDFYDIPQHHFKNAYVPKDWKHKFRKGSKDEWRDILTLDQQQRINEQIPDEFFTFFGWER